MKVHNIKVDSRVFVVEFSSYEWSSNLLAFSTSQKIIVGSVKFEDESAEEEKSEFVFERIIEIDRKNRVNSISWSQESSLRRIPKCLCFAAGGRTNISLYSSDCKKTEEKILSGHTDYVNSVSYEPETGKQIASASDDHTSRVWNTESLMEEARFYLTSPGMSVCWHSEDPGKLLVATKDGIIHFYNVSSQQPLMSLNCGTSPLMSADWSLGNNLHVGVVVGTDWQVWDISRPSRPLVNHTVYTDGATQLRLSRHNDSFVATIGRPNNELKVCHIRSNHVPVSTSLQVGGGISWHFRLAVLAVAGDEKVTLYNLMMP